MPKKILIVSFTFPPMPGIGGKRWAKFAKVLQKKGHKVCVLSAKPDENDYSPWDAAVKDTKRYFINRPSPLHSLNGSNSILDKIKYRLALEYTKKLKKGNIFDRAIYWEKDFFKKTTNIIIKEKIDFLIVTGAPFRLLYFGTLLKEKFPNIYFIADIRDPWSWGVFGFNFLSAKRIVQEHKMEKKVMQTADIITVPVEEMRNVLSDKYPKNRSKIYHLPHGFDASELPSRHKIIEDKYIRLIYGGMLYEGLNDSYLKVKKVLKENQNIHFTIYSDVDRYDDLFSTDEGEGRFLLERKAAISSRQFLNEVANSHFYVSLVNERIKNYLSSKYFELIKIGIPIIIIGPIGELSQFISENGFGYHFLNDDNLIKNLKFCLTNSVELEKKNASFDIDTFSFDGIMENLMHHIQVSGKLE